MQITNLTVAEQINFVLCNFDFVARHKVNYVSQSRENMKRTIVRTG